MPTLYIDNEPHAVADGKNLLETCLSLGFNVPYFCWHPALGSVGSCRLCAVKLFKDEHDIQGRIVMSCMTQVAEGMRISIDDPEVKAFRKSVLEWLMTNHPHDCPVCDEGGECHLQDMTVMCGHNYRKYRFEKRTFRNQDLGPFINHEMNRCIQCYRCVRFYRDYAGGRDFNVFSSHNHVYFGRHADGPLESEFSGNLVEVCPTGVFTDKTLKKHYTRRWDLQAAPSICVHCGAGCNITPGERYGVLRRIRNRYNSEVNGYFLCDRGRYGYEFVNGEKRVRLPLRRSPEGFLKPTAKAVVMPLLAEILSEAKGIIGIGSPRASLESNFALRAFVGPDHFYAGVEEPQQRLTALTIDLLADGLAKSPSMQEIAASDAVLVLGEDVTNTAPRIALAIRQSVQGELERTAEAMGIPNWNDGAARTAVQAPKSRVFVVGTNASRLDDAAVSVHYAAPDDIARLGFAIARVIDPQAPPVPDLREEDRQLAERIACELSAAGLPLVVSGPSIGSEVVLLAATAVANALSKGDKRAGLCFTAPECNTIGLELLGATSINEGVNAVLEGAADTIIVLENDLFRRTNHALVEMLFGAAKHLVVIDHTMTKTATWAEIFLPAATFAEGDGTLVNNEGRGQRFIQVFMPTGDVQESWRWVRDLGVASGRWADDKWTNLDGIVAEMADELPKTSGIKNIAPPAAQRIAGQKIPRQSHRYSGRTAMRANIDVSETGIPQDPDSPLTFSMEGFAGEAPSSLQAFFWSPGWNSVQSINKFQDEVGGALSGGDPGVRLIEPVLPAGGTKHEIVIPEAFKPRADEWLFVPFYHIYGSDEMSMLSPSVAERAPAAFVVFAPLDAEKLKLIEGDMVEVLVNGCRHVCPAALNPSLPPGVAGLSAGTANTEPIELPAWGKISLRNGS